MHPHVVLTCASTQEAADALHWSYTDRLLSHPQPIQPPFSQEELSRTHQAPQWCAHSAFYTVLLFLMFPYRSWPAIWSFIHVHGCANPITSRCVLFLHWLNGIPRLYLVHSILVPGPLQAAKTSTPRHQSYAHCKAHADPPHSAGNRRRDTMPRDPIPLCRQSEIQ